MKDFSFSIPQNVFFGEGVLKKLPEAAGKLKGTHAFIISGLTLKKMGVVLKRAHYFIMCNGRMMYHIPIKESYRTARLTDEEHKDNWKVVHQNEKYEQLSLF